MNKLYYLSSCSTCKRIINQWSLTKATDLIDVKNQSAVFAYVKQTLNQLEDVLQGIFLVGELSKKSLDFESFSSKPIASNISFEA